MPRLTRASDPNKLNPLIMIVVLGLAGLYLFTTLTTGSGETLAFQRPESASTLIMTVFKIIVIGAIVIAANTLATRLGSPLGRKDSFTLILLGLLIWFLWDKVLVDILNAPTLDDVTFTAALKMGFVP